MNFGGQINGISTSEEVTTQMMTEVSEGKKCPQNAPRDVQVEELEASFAQVYL